MKAPNDKSTYIHSLERFMERLSSADLTAAESMEIRPRLFQLLGEIDGWHSVDGETDGSMALTLSGGTPSATDSGRNGRI